MWPEGRKDAGEDQTGDGDQFQPAGLLSLADELRFDPARSR